jgi:hypothetical protein
MCRCCSSELWHPEDGDSMFLWNIGTYLQVYMASQPIRTTSTFSPLWEPELCEGLKSSSWLQLGALLGPLFV